MDRQQLRGGFLLLVLLLLGYELYRLFSPFFATLMWAGVLALVFSPLYRYLAKRLRLGRGTAAALLTGAIFLAFVLPALILSWVLASEAVAFYRSFQDFIQAGGLAILLERPWLKGFLRLWLSLDNQLRAMGVDLKGVSLRGAEAMTGLLVSWMGSAVKNVLVFLVNLSLMAVALFFLFRDGEGLLTWLQRVLPLRSQEVEAIFRRLGSMIAAIVRGTLLTAVVQGTLTGVALWAMGVPFPVMLGFLTILCALFPTGGSGLVWVPSALYLAIQGFWIKGVFLAAWGVLVVGTVDNLLKPILIAGKAALHSGLLFFGILGGLVVFGFSGLILGPVLLALFLTCVELYTKLEQPPEREDEPTSPPRRS